VENKALILHIESATDVCSVALARDGQYLHHVEENGTLQHASIITLLIQRLLDEANEHLKELDAVALSEGPGSYTSLRVGMSVAKGICYGRDIPLLAINTLEAMAYEVRRQEPSADMICSMIDARRMEVYASLYDQNMDKIVDNQALILDEESFDSYFEKGHHIALCGNGSAKSKALWKGKSVRYFTEKTDARYLIAPAYEQYKRGLFADLAYFSPNYIKSPNITKAKKKLL
jgi:tRNA threonylcarbamoyladenosine biosynthesis protein TsaB